MLIDVSRRPVRLIYEECPDTLVVRTMKVKGKVTGVIHQDVSSLNSRSNPKENVVAPHVSLLQKGFEYIETILQDIRVVPEDSFQARLEEGGFSRYGYDKDWRPGGLSPEQTDSTEPYYVISGYTDQSTKATGSWRVNFVLGRTPNDQRLVTLLDATHGAVLFTAQLPPVSSRGSKVVTPLERFIQNPESKPGLWSAVLDDSDEL